MSPVGCALCGWFFYKYLPILYRKVPRQYLYYYKFIIYCHRDHYVDDLTILHDIFDEKNKHTKTELQTSFMIIIIIPMYYLNKSSVPPTYVIRILLILWSNVFLKCNKKNIYKNTYNINLTCNLYSIKYNYKYNVIYCLDF